MFEQHPGRSGQLPGHCPDRDNAVGPGFLALIKSLRQWFKSNGKMSRLGKRPGEILVARLGITFTFLFTVAVATRKSGKSGDSIPIKDKPAVSSFVVSFWVN